MAGSIRLHLSGHCIETEAKNEFKRLMDIYFTSDDVPDDLEHKINFMREFIESSDFYALRASDSRLEGEDDIYVDVVKGEDNTFHIKFP